MKFLYCTDIHIKGKNPVNRLDNYYQSCLEKIDEIIQIAKRQDCKFIICGGDLFDSPNVSNTIIDDFVDKVEASKIDWHIVSGNHDMTGHNWEVSKASALAHIFRRSKSIMLLDTIDGTNYYIKGYKYYHTIEEDFKEKGLKHRKKNKFTIAISHAFISIKPFFKEVSHICAKDLQTNYDLVLCSHFHTNFDEIINGTRFLNTNSIGRSSITEQHTPQVAIIDTAHDIMKIDLESAKKANEIFDLSKYEELKANKKDIKEFLQSLKNVDFQSMSISEQIVKIGKEQKVDKEIVDYLLNKIGEVK